jgi:iron complex transport system permease protein
VLAGVVTAFCGPIGFLGVAVPHLARGLVRTGRHLVVLPASALGGACVSLLASIIASVPGSDIVLPINAVTALIGTPIVGWVILRRRSVAEAFSR